MRNIGKHRRQVLGIREKPDPVDVAIGDEIEPAAREPDYAADPQARDATNLTDARRSRTWHPRDRAERSNSSVEESLAEAVAAPQEETGRPSNAVQHRLSKGQVDHLIHLYRDSASIDGLARRYEVHRTTVIAHLERAGIARRRVVRKLTDESVTEAAERYERGASLAKVAGAFGVHERTITREFRRAGVSIRPRRGWCP